MHGMTRLNSVAKWTVIMHMYMYMYAYPCTHMYVHAHICTQVQASAFTSKCACMYVRAEAHTVRPICYTSTCIWDMYTCTCTCTCTFSGTF